MGFLKENRKEFEAWLTEQMSYSRVSAKDCCSRCKRIEKVLGIDLEFAVSSAREYEKLSDAINQYSIEISKTKESAYTLSGTLRRAAKCFAMYKTPSLAKDYKTAHGRFRYRVF
jgi:hypothetical protein